MGSKSVMRASNAKINRASEVERGDEDVPADLDALVSSAV